ncbi:HDOD domain-containing protein [Colwellia sp. MB02u-18]|uniref:HDOD domain-containing protein n=1 Tax=unclassified Colwellia TaxID=196834 RepID=UPI0015F579A5|nr:MULTISPECIES: HDOD domain-containing protein [unclassified Colwellia]MBA6222727.1 HDOD domain-containing protein [Colwellia sp. MB3u-45]MBA6266066.1 HDOD domain-containing protein [Colwellia sp. MB3u-43]MBA6320506.1 HDOD domain-containing protein [Colwellia sp. MB02u-19]MBA6323393.1 HDOD domain-containing protein [Colwellia sp. MB02u-18]MBA6329891.1 HDOD domain-containing protein [Colwellia sp. MB02u-12]
MFNKLLSQLFQKTESSTPNVYFFEESRQDVDSEKEVENQQANKNRNINNNTNHDGLMFYSFEDEYQQNFYDYLLGESNQVESPNDHELSQLISSKIQGLLKNPKLILDVLPILPLSLTKIIQQINNQDFDTEALIQLIQQEPAIAAKVIELANSVYYNRNNKEITDLKSAFLLLGANGLSEGVINGFVNKLVPNSTIYFRQYGQKIWQHSLSTGITAKALVAKSSIKASAAQAYFIGLICNLGDLVIYQLLTDAFAIVHPDCQPNSTLFKNLMAKESKKLTYFIAKHWNFPDSILDALALQAKVKRAALLPTLHHKMPLACYVYEAKIISQLELRLAHSAIDDEYIKEVSTSLLFTEEANNQLQQVLADKQLEKT